MIADYHNHTSFSFDARGSMEEYVVKAQEKGINEIGFSDHMLIHESKNYTRMTPETMPAYGENFRRV